MTLTSEQALDIARQFHDLSTAVGDYRFGHWDELTKEQRDKLKDAQIMLLNHSSHMVTEAVGLVLDDAQGGLDALTKTTAKAQKVLATIADIKQGIEIVASLVKLSAAIASENPAAIASAVEETAGIMAG